MITSGAAAPQGRRGQIQAVATSATGLTCFIFRFLRRPPVVQSALLGVFLTLEGRFPWPRRSPSFLGVIPTAFQLALIFDQCADGGLAGALTVGESRGAAAPLGIAQRKRTKFASLQALAPGSTDGSAVGAPFLG